MIKKMDKLNKMDWEFSDYRGFQTFSSNINKLHWYPAPFVPQIPSVLIQRLSDKRDVVLDPFSGSGVTPIEAIRLNRRAVGIDINPYAIDILNAKISALSFADENWISEIKDDMTSLKKINNTLIYCENNMINQDVFHWFEKETLKELCSLHYYVVSETDENKKLMKKVLFSSILNRSCSQRDHYTYVTDRCFPKEMHWIDAFKIFFEQCESVFQASKDFRKNYSLMHKKDLSNIDAKVVLGDSREIDFLKDNEVDLVVTSPPYLGVNDYVRSMRLTNLFFQEYNIEDTVKNEIGARYKRKRKNAYDEYISDMKSVFSEISRVLKPSGYFCLIIGTGSGRVNKGNVMDDIISYLKTEYEYEILLRTSRQIKFRRIQVKGVGNEEIIILNREGNV